MPHQFMRTAIVCAAVVAMSLPAAAQEMEFFTIGSGNVSGGYYAAARAICNAVNGDAANTLRCSPDPTAGSIYNIDALREGEIDFALVQSDWQRQAFEGVDRYAGAGQFADMRSVMGLYPETVTLIAGAGSGIERPQDIAGRRIDIGHPSSGRHETNLHIFGEIGLDPGTFAILEELPVDRAVSSLCADRLDATILVVGHPNADVARALTRCDATLVAASGPAVDQFVSGSTDYARTIIPGGTYAEIEADVPTFSVTATLVTRADIDASIVERLVDAVIDNLATLARDAPVLDGLDPARMPVAGLTAPLHPGAETAYRAAGVR